MVTLRGVQTTTITLLKAMKLAELHKMNAGNDVWATAMADSGGQLPLPGRKGVSNAPLSDLLDEFIDMFTTLCGLLPHRQYDHAVTQVEGMVRANNSRISAFCGAHM
ncbi:hypothetical protein D1007_21413 [Hordeum vulgare]|nr:hypothetical protein D1007_21413 [Hordeum vulgare]